MSQGASTRTKLWLTTCAVGAAALLAVGNASAATWVIRGHGFGHGVGMSQWGAYGFARHGRDYKAILGHYYRHTHVGRAAAGSIRVLLTSGAGSVSFRRATKACGRRLRPHHGYAFVRSGSGIELRRARGRRVARCGQAATARGRGAIRIGGQGLYRGTLKVKSSGGGLEVINAVGLDAYAKGVVANEEPSSWPQAALRAQAVAARSFGLASHVARSFDVYDDTRSQVYGGKASETAATNRACKRTSDRVVKYRHRIATTYFFSSSGGRTESIQFGFPGSSPVPYLRSVDDPYDTASPQHSWRVRYSQGEMESRLGWLFSGRLRKVKVLKRGDCPRIVLARVVGTHGSSRSSGPGLPARVGLDSTWARFHKR